MTSNYKIFVVTSYLPNQFPPFYLLVSQLEEAERLIKIWGIKSFVLEEHIGPLAIEAGMLCISTLEGRPQIPSNTKSVSLTICGHE